MDTIRPRRPRPRPSSTVRRTALPAALAAMLLLAAGCAVEEPGSPADDSSTAAASSPSSAAAESDDSSTPEAEQDGGEGTDETAEAAPESANPEDEDDGATSETSSAPSAPGLPAPEELDADGMERSEELGAYFSRDEACMAVGSTLDGLRADMDGGLQSAEDLAGAHEAVEQTYRMVPASLREPFAAVDEALGADVESLDRQAVLDALQPVDSWMEQTCDGEYHSQDEGAEQDPQG